jgi:uncharacterized protein (DUF2147 family)
MKPILFLLLSLLPASSIAADSMVQGVWLTGTNHSKIETYEENGEWFGKLIYSDDSSSEIGTIILRNFKPDGDVWKGQIFAMKRNKIYNAELTPTGSQLIIKVTSGLFSRTLEWPKEPAKAGAPDSP